MKSISISPADTLQVLAGIESSVGSPDRIMKTTDGGLTWSETWSGTFSYFGQWSNFPHHPDTVYTIGSYALSFGRFWLDTGILLCTGKGSAPGATQP